MTDETSTTSHLSVAVTTSGIDKTQTTGENNTTSSSSSGYLEWAVISIGVVGTIGNAVILYALVASKQHKKQVLIVNQNALDLFSSFFLVITYIMEVCNVNNNLTGVTGYWLCISILSGNFIWWGTNGSMVNLAIITIDRYLKVVHPIRSKKWLRPWVVYSEVAFSWFVGSVYNTILVLYSTAVIDGKCYSYAIFDSYVTNMASVVFYIWFFYVIILAIFIFCYGRILVKIRNQARVMASHNAAGPSTAQNQSNQIQSNVIKTMIFVSAFYAIAWLPYNIYYLLASTRLVPTLSFSDYGYYTIKFIAFFYTAANPFVYGTKFNPVRQILRKMIPCKKSLVQPTDCPGTSGMRTSGRRTGQTRI